LFYQEKDFYQKKKKRIVEINSALKVAEPNDFVLLEVVTLSFY
jgi:hypothetical protein